MLTIIQLQLSPLQLNMNQIIMLTHEPQIWTFDWMGNKAGVGFGSHEVSNCDLGRTEVSLLFESLLGFLCLSNSVCWVFDDSFFDVWNFWLFVSNEKERYGTWTVWGLKIGDKFVDDLTGLTAE